jgi:hypothetical protein
MGIKLYPTDVAFIITQFPSPASTSSKPFVLYRDFVRGLHLCKKKPNKKAMAAAEAQFRAQMFEIAHQTRWQKRRTLGPIR